MIYIQCLILSKDDTFLIKPLWCPIEQPFCVAKFGESSVHTCPFYCGDNILIDGRTYVYCKYGFDKEQRGKN
jgi:hypothetical protein